MSIKELIEKFKDVPPDRILLKELVIRAEIINVPEKSLLSGYIILGDDTGTLEAVAPNNVLYDQLKFWVSKKNTLKLKGHLDKTEYGNIAFEIEEILE